MTYFATMPSPIGELTLCSNGEALTGLYFSTGSKARSADPAWRRDDACLAPAVAQLQEYFAGQRSAFDLALAPPTTEFQHKVLNALLDIPYGQMRSYKDIAYAIGNPKAVRAVGTANGNNPIAIIIPCHRVVGSNGVLTGFGGGLPAKRWLLDLESQHAQFTLSN
ncbi:MAG: methylated-DNA--[protein]-cysteine S-methyltransferase [Pseudomonadota bacterium]|nr:methylated-DNA--[protein]-cysteine S-methyltransferase [Pseudomonadota bacterium]